MNKLAYTTSTVNQLRERSIVMKSVVSKLRRQVLQVLVFAISTTSVSANTENLVFATKITTQNANRLISKGPNAIGGVNDWFITNGTLCGIVSDVNHESQLSLKGGALVDLGFCGRADDHFLATNDLLQGSQKRPIDTYRISIEHGDQWATIVVEGVGDGAKMEKRYTLRSDTPNQLHITKKLSQSSSSLPLSSYTTTIKWDYHHHQYIQQQSKVIIIISR